MEKKVSHLIEADDVIAAADSYPLIRSFKSSYQMSETPLDEVGDNSIGWFECNSQTTGDNVSAVAYIFALNVLDHVQYPRVLLAELIRASRPGGYLFLFVDIDKPPDQMHPHTIKSEWLRNILDRYWQMKLWQIEPSWKFKNDVLYAVGVRKEA